MAKTSFRNEEYYDIEDALFMNMNSPIDDLFYLKDLKQRKMFINCNIEQGSVADVVRHIMQINKEDNVDNVPVEDRVPIKLYLCSDGGDVDAGFELIDVIKNSKTPVHIINIGWCYSMAFLIYLSGHKRFASENAKFLLHDGSSFVYDSSSKARDRMEFQNAIEKKIKDFVIAHTNITDSEYEEAERKEWYMFSEEAKSRGIVDYIIGKDVELDEVV